MKFPRNAKILRSPFDIAPFAAVFFLLVIFVMLGGLMPVPGIPLDPPAVANLPGVDQPVVAVAVDSQGTLYYQNKMITEPELTNRLAAACAAAPEPPTLVIHADKQVTYWTLTHLVGLARTAGITNTLLATLPRVTDPPLRHE